MHPLPQALSLLAVALAISGCGDRASFDATGQAGYLQRPLLTESLFPQDSGTTSNADIAQALESRVPIRDHFNLAVLPIGSWADLDPGRTASIQAGINAALAGQKHIAAVTRIPTLILPTGTENVGRIREACARLQCDMVLIYGVHERLRLHTSLLGHDHASSWMTTEAMLLDVRTGMVPWADLVDRDVTAAGDRDKDIDAWEQAKDQALQASTGSMATDLAHFFASVP